MDGVGGRKAQRDKTTAPVRNAPGLPATGIFTRPAPTTVSTSADGKRTPLTAALPGMIPLVEAATSRVPLKLPILGFTEPCQGAIRRPGMGTAARLKLASRAKVSGKVVDHDGSGRPPPSMTTFRNRS